MPHDPRDGRPGDDDLAAPRGPYRDGEIARDPYRGGAPDTALPIARRRIGAYTAIIAAAAVVALAAGVPAIASARRTAEIARVADSGPLAIGVLALFLPFAARMFGTRLARGALPGWAVAPLVAVALSPVVIAAISVARGARALVPALTVVRVPEAPQVFASGLGAAAQLTLWACVVAALASLIVALGGVASVATVDREKVSARPGPAWAALLVGGAWFVAAFAVRIADRAAFASSSLLAAQLAAPLIVTALAAVAAWTAPALGRVDLPRDASASVVALIGSAVAALAFTLLLVFGSLAAFEARALVEASAPALGGVERAGVLQTIVAARHAHAVAALVDAAFCAACFAVPVGSALRASAAARAREPACGWVTLAVAAVALAVGAQSGARGAVARSTAAAFAHRGESIAFGGSPAEVDLPSARVPVPAYARGGGAVVTVPRAGVASVRGVRAPWERVEIRADGAATFAATISAVRAERARETWRASAERAAPATLILAPATGAPVAGLGELAPLVGPTERALDVDLAPASATDAEDVLTVTLDDAPFVHARRFGRTIDLTLARGSDDTGVAEEILRWLDRGDPPAVVRVVPRGGDTMARVTSVVATVANALRDGAGTCPRVEVLFR